MTTPAKPPAQHVAVRLDNETLARLDALLPVFSLPARAGTRSDVLRAAILLGLSRFEDDFEGARSELARVGRKEPPPE